MQPQSTKYDFLCESLRGILDEPRDEWRSFPCLLWPFSKTALGYGQLSRDNRPITAHILAFELAYGKRTRRCRISHRCPEKACYRPSHLFSMNNLLEYLEDVLRGLSFDPSLPWNTYPCLDWPFSVMTSGGYGNLRHEGELIRVPRYAYEFFNGPLPDGMLACHHCDRPVCFHPAHIFAGSDVDNSRDMWNKGRGFAPGRELDFNGEQNPFAKLTWGQVREIRALYASTVRSQRKLAVMFGLSQPHVGKIVRGELWKEPSSSL